MSLALRSSFVLAAAFVALAPAPFARADMPGGGGPDCEMQEGCVQCEKLLDEEDNAAYDSCVADADADGLQLSCSEGVGASDVEYWCPEGVDANAGCSASAAPVTQGVAFLVACAAALGVSLSRRRARTLRSRA